MQLCGSILFLALFSLPFTVDAQCHHYSGHSHGGHIGGRSTHFHGSGHGGRSSALRERTSDPMKHEHEFAAGAGVLTGLQVLDMQVTKASPVYLLSYKYYVTDGLAISISAGVQTVSGTDTCHCRVGTANPSLFQFRATGISTTVGLTWVYFAHGPYQLYGGAECGNSFLPERDRYADNAEAKTSTHIFNAQVSPVGFRYGNKIGVFAEVGFGYKGVVNMGLSYQAGRKKARRYS